MAKFNLSNTHLTTANMGTTFPVNCTEVLPGDSIRAKTGIFLRFQPMLAPIMHQVQMKIHHWFVPNRILWNEWEDFITGGVDSGEMSPTFPTITLNTKNDIRLFDYFGIPTESVHDGIKVSALPFRAYQMIYNEWYRDQNLQEERPISFGSGPDTVTDTRLFNSAWKKDYFTTARLTTQLGASVSIPITQSLEHNTVMFSAYSPNANFSFTVDAPSTKEVFESYPHEMPVSGANYAKVRYKLELSPDKKTVTVFCAYRTGYWENELGYTSGSYTSPVSPLDFKTAPYVEKIASHFTYGGSSKTLNVNASSVVFPFTREIGDAGVFEIRDLRLGSAIQRYQERSLKYGNRYNEYLLSEWGVSPQDSRLQLPEYLGGGRQFVSVSEVLQTAEGTNTGVGTMRGHGVGVVRSNSFRRFIPEHGWIITLCTVAPLPLYTQGLDKSWLRRSKFDFFTRELDSVGMEEILQQELFATKDNEGVIFGYNDRYDSYRRKFGKVSGEFRDTLNFWHLARNFEQAPSLNSSFIECVPSKRIFAEQTTNPLLMYVQNSISARRKIPKRARNILR